MTSRQRRATRGLAAASLAVVLASVSHTAGGGSAPAPWLVLAAIVLAWPLTTAVIGAGVRMPGQAAAVVAAQVVLHALFSVAGHASAGAVAHVHGEAIVLPPLAQAMHTVAPTPAMVCAHLLAAAAALVLLRHGEAAVRTVAGWALALLDRPAPSALAMPACPRTCAAAPAAPRPRLITGPRHRRGPPVFSR